MQLSRFWGYRSNNFLHQRISPNKHHQSDAAGEVIFARAGPLTNEVYQHVPLSNRVGF
jgi:hypothetical protein